MAEQHQAKLVPVVSLTPAPWNPRTIKDERFQNLCRSLETDPDFLWLRPILATVDGTVFGGNMRLRAAQHLGWTAIPAILLDIPEQLARERALRDNGSWGDWVEDDLARLLDELKVGGAELEPPGFGERELQSLLDRVLHEQEGAADPDEVPPLPDEPVTKRGDLWLLGEHRVLCGDATDPHDVAIAMNGERAKLMATDPPYLVNYRGGSHPPSKANRPETRDKHWDDYKDPESAVGFYAAYLEAAFPHLVERAPIYQWHANTRQALVDEAWRQTGLLAHQVIVWVKTRGVLTRSHYMWQHEPCMYGWSHGRRDVPSLRRAPAIQQCILRRCVRPRRYPAAHPAVPRAASADGIVARMVSTVTSLDSEISEDEP